MVYPRRSDAIQALKKYNNVLLDGRPMRLEILGGNNAEAPPLSGRVNVNVSGLNGRLKRTVVIQYNFLSFILCLSLVTHCTRR